jgi:hypothetical protein
MNIAVATYPRLYVRPMEKHELELVTSNCTMSCNVLLQDNTRHIYVVSARHLLSLQATSPGARALGMAFSSTIGLAMCLKSTCYKRVLILRGGTFGWRFVVFGRELIEIDRRMWYG